MGEGGSGEGEDEVGAPLPEYLGESEKAETGVTVEGLLDMRTWKWTSPQMRSVAN